MAANLRTKVKSLGVGAAAVACAGAVAAWASVVLSGTKTGAVLSTLLTIGPVLLYAVIIAPLAFPFGAYVVVTPLEEVLTVPMFGTMARLLGAVSAIALLLYMIRTKRLVDPPRALGIWIVLFLWAGASLLWAIDVPRAWELLSTSLQLFALYIVIMMFPVTPRQLSGLVYATIGGGTIAACYAVYLYWSGVSIQNRLAISSDNSAGDPNHFAASLIVPLVLALFVFLWNKNRAIKTCMLPPAGLMMAAILLSGSRGAVLGCIAALLFLAFRDPHRRTLGLLFGVLAVVGAAVAGPSIGARFSEALVNGGAGRLDIWHVGWIAFTQNWLFGAGYENFPFAYDKAYMQVFQPFYASWHRAPHNLLLGTAVDLGVVGLGLMLAAWVSQFRLLAPVGREDPRYGLKLALQACVIALFIVAMFSDIMTRKYTWLLFMLIALTRNATGGRVQRA